MTVLRMDNVAIVVDDLPAAIAFFVELGLELQGQATIEGPWADLTVGLEGVRSEIAMVRTPDGHSQLELTKYHSPPALNPNPSPPPNTVGLHRVMFAVDDLDDTLARLKPHGAEVLGEVANYENIFRLCYLRGPAGIIVALAQQVG
jgi:catechol 2,3-dioxygenase-like lactoylglutathione lyase family enzyme